jgi:hypothetical protein
MKVSNFAIANDNGRLLVEIGDVDIIKYWRDTQRDNTFRREWRVNQ